MTERAPDRCEQWHQGRRNGIKWAVEWLHRRAKQMNDHQAEAILNTAAWNMGVDGKYDANGEEASEK